jgi:DNA gyrase inhibitor GyrI
MKAQRNTAPSPEIVFRPVRVYAYIAHRVPLADIGKVAEAGFDRLDAWLKRDGLASTGAPFLRYRRIDMAGTIDIETGIPVEDAGVGDEVAGFAEIPAGHYARLLWRGSFDSLVVANTRLIEWGRQRNIAWDMTPSDEGDIFRARLETFLVGPAQEPDPGNWLTEIAIRTSNGKPDRPDP